MYRAPCIEHYTHKFNRLFVVGDIHGCYQQLMLKLEQVNFDFQRDILVAVGDLVDRGPESLKCLNLIDQSWFKAILGNHEEMCLLSEHDAAMADLHSRHGGEWFYALDQAQRQQARMQCRKLPIILEIQYQDKRYGFVHADIDRNHWDEFKRAIQQNYEIALWSRGRIRNKRPYMYRQIQGIDWVFLGHTVVEEVTQRDNCYFIDTGAVFGKALSLIEIDLACPVEQQLKVIA